MSNVIVGDVYQAIIEEVINSSRVDFEENGVEESVLEELRQGWQQKLSQLDVASFPWDPKPEPAPVPQQVPQMEQQGRPQGQPAAAYLNQLPLPGQAGAAPTGYNGAMDGSYVKQEPGVAIKQEPGTQQAMQYQAYNGADNKNNVAASRAAQQLQAQYGARATGSINAIQAGQQTQQQGYQLPGGPLPQQGASGSAANNQTDGAGDDEGFDYEGVLLERSKAGTLNELGRVDIDRILHSQIAARSRAMEGGGLMLPLKQATAASKQASGAAPRRSRKGKEVAAFDGGDDDDDDDEEEDDENAINSDLDDPDEESDDEEQDDDSLGHIMLCTYDKVQRVKNKWKCTLKDGVLTVNGKEYLFQKATGEYEW